MTNAVDIELSEKMAKAVNARTRECYRNSFLAAMSLGGLSALVDGVEVFYVEGFCIWTLPFQHGWVEIVNDGKTSIVDPTLVLLRDLEEYQWIAGRRFPFWEMTKIWDENLDEDGHLPVPLVECVTFDAYQGERKDAWDTAWGAAQIAAYGEDVGKKIISMTEEVRAHNQRLFTSRRH